MYKFNFFNVLEELLIYVLQVFLTNLQNVKKAIDKFCIVRYTVVTTQQGRCRVLTLHVLFVLLEIKIKTDKEF